MTNYEKIKAMSVEEMAHAMKCYLDCRACPVFRTCHSPFGILCPHLLEDWLLQEAEE